MTNKRLLVTAALVLVAAGTLYAFWDQVVPLKPRVAASDVKRKIEDALKRSAELDASRISMEAMSSKVTLRGSVRSWAERTESERAA
jgi:osmotically-inducible protein OsmY